MNKKSKKIIGVSGTARSGKNLFCDLSVKFLKDKYNIESSVFSLAYNLKMDCSYFLKEKLDIDVFTEETEIKSIFREFLVWYGDVTRERTSGTKWSGLLTEPIMNCKSEVVFISDIRYAQYPKDELFWLKNQLNGKLVHISKYYYEKNGIKKYTLPANQREKENDPILKQNADFCIDWMDISQDVGYDINLKENGYLNNIVEECLDTII
jgi:hypothetical protein